MSTRAGKVIVTEHEGIRVEWSQAQYARLQEIKARPASLREMDRTRNALPRDPADFSNAQRRAYAEVFGDALAEDLFGFGPWLSREQSRLSRERKNRREARR